METPSLLPSKQAGRSRWNRAVETAATTARRALRRPKSNEAPPAFAVCRTKSEMNPAGPRAGEGCRVGGGRRCAFLAATSADGTSRPCGKGPSALQGLFVKDRGMKRAAILAQSPAARTRAPNPRVGSIAPKAELAPSRQRLIPNAQYRSAATSVAGSDLPERKDPAELLRVYLFSIRIWYKQERAPG
jgi:hypothetical protein